MLICDNNSQHYIFKNFTCWSGVHIIHAVLAIAISLIFLAICITISLTYYKSRSSSNDSSARVNSRADSFVLLEKIILNYLYTFLNAY